MLVTAIFFLLASAYFVYGYFMQIGVDQGYQPVQPIHFSHKIHAGDNGSIVNIVTLLLELVKHSGIPSLNVCMNCHKSIYEYNGEVYCKNMIKSFMMVKSKNYMLLAGWSDADQKYTGETQPVKWVRIHNLPDFAYFNHSQHVSVAGLNVKPVMDLLKKWK